MTYQDIAIERLLRRKTAFGTPRVLPEGMIVHVEVRHLNRAADEIEQMRKALDWIASSSLDAWAVGVAMEILGHGPRDRSLDPPASNEQRPSK